MGPEKYSDWKINSEWFEKKDSQYKRSYNEIKDTLLYGVSLEQVQALIRKYMPEACI